MSQAYKCNVCGVCFDEFDGEIDLKRKGITYQLCGTCLKQIDRILKGNIISKTKRDNAYMERQRNELE